MTRYLVLCTLFLSACSPDYRPMTNDEIITELKKCKDAGFDAERYSRGMDYKTYRVECRPRNEK